MIEYDERHVIQCRITENIRLLKQMEKGVVKFSLSFFKLTTNFINNSNKHVITSRKFIFHVGGDRPISKRLQSINLKILSRHAMVALAKDPLVNAEKSFNCHRDFETIYNLDQQLLAWVRST